MDSIMSKFFKSSIMMSIFLIILGGLLIFESEMTIVSISYVIGGTLIALGAVAILRFIKNARNMTSSELDIIYGVVTIILGSLIVTHPKGLASIIPIVLGICIVINSANKLQYSLELKKDNNKLWKMTLAVAIVSTLCGVILIFNPFKGVQMITQIVGIFIVTYAVLDMISTITIKRNVSILKKAIKDTITDAEIIEEKEVKKK